MCMKIKFTEDDLIIFDNLISAFLTLCSNICPNLMTVKFHHLIHYSHFIMQYGSPRLFSTLSFESLHSELKFLMKSSNNWRNQCLTIGKKYARLRAIDSQKDCLIYKNIVNIPCPNSVLFNSERVESIGSFEFYNITYKSGILIRHFHDTISYCFLEINDIYKSNECIIFYGNLYKGNYNIDLNYIEHISLHKYIQ